uniref:CRISPR-associated endonuclease Cas1 n=1 Tax=Candidatus Kentrum sp. DK TaxID=2126562 RepID=A0A450S3J6_9GAMM|nr:MAG: CRISP-associated protein Cas1 [Candidatus Kentron sp. DK]
MIGRVVEIVREGAHLSLHRGFLRVSEAGKEVGHVAVEDIGALIVRGYGATVSVNLCSRLAEAGVPVVLCGANQSPDALIWPVRGHFEQGRRMQAQSEAGRPLRKRLWRDLVAAKIRAQEEVLFARFGKQDERLRWMIKTLKSGDPENLEAQAARHYWPRLMGERFRRNRDADGVNAALNYGYTVLRAAAARAILAAGLHPSLSVHHESRGNALRLADDLMEPFRPYVDGVVAEWVGQGEFEIDKERKAALVAVLTLDLAGPNGARPVQSCLDALATSLAMVYTGEGRGLELPGGAFSRSHAVRAGTG